MKGIVCYPWLGMARPEWFVRSLLFWDYLAIIAPQSYASGCFDALTKQYVERELLLVAYPEDGWDLLLPGCDTYLRNLDENEMTARRLACRAGQVTEVHLEKAHCENYQLVYDLGLASPIAACVRRRSGVWGKVETKTAREYSGALAAAVSHPLSDFAQRHPGVQWVPSTDEPNSTLHLLGGRSRFAAEDERHAARVRSSERRSEYLTVILERLLPVPSAHDVSVDMLMKFRRRHGEEMRSFRMQIEDRVAEIVRESDGDERVSRLDRVSEEFEQQIRNAEKRFSDWGLQTVARAPLIQVFRRGDPAYIAQEGISSLARVAIDCRKTASSAVYIRKARRKVLRYKGKTAAIPILAVPESPLIEAFGFNRPHPGEPLNGPERRRVCGPASTRDRR